MPPSAWLTAMYIRRKKGCDEGLVSRKLHRIIIFLYVVTFVASTRGCIARDYTPANFSTSPPPSFARMLNCNESVREFSNFCLQRSARGKQSRGRRWEKESRMKFALGGERNSSQFLQFATKLNPSPLTFESRDSHFIILLEVVNSDRNSVILYPRICYYTSKTSCFRGQGLVFYFPVSKTSKSLFKTKQKKKKKKLIFHENFQLPFNTVLWILYTFLHVVHIAYTFLRLQILPYVSKSPPFK